MCALVLGFTFAASAYAQPIHAAGKRGATTTADCLDVVQRSFSDRDALVGRADDIVSSDGDPDDKLIALESAALKREKRGIASGKAFSSCVKRLAAGAGAATVRRSRTRAASAPSVVRTADVPENDCTSVFYNAEISAYSVLSRKLEAANALDGAARASYLLRAMEDFQVAVADAMSSLLACLADPIVNDTPPPPVDDRC